MTATAKSRLKEAFPSAKSIPLAFAKPKRAKVGRGGGMGGGRSWEGGREGGGAVVPC